MNKDQITALARLHGSTYTNRHFPGEPAFAFGNEGWADFCADLMDHVPDAGEMVADRVPAAGETMAAPHPAKGTSALAIKTSAPEIPDNSFDAAPVVPAPVAIPACIHVTEAMHRAAVKVLHRAHGLDGLPQRMMDAMLAAAPTTPKEAS